jgi:predicted dehydrogenase
VVCGRLDGGATISGQFLLGVRPTLTPLVTIMGTNGTLTLTPDASDGQIQMSSLTVRGAHGTDQLQPLPLPDDYQAVPEDLPAGSASSVAHMYLAIEQAKAGRGEPVPDFHDAVRLHELLDTLEKAAATGQRQTIS